MQYRIHTLSPVGRILFGTDADCASDEAAFLMAGATLSPGRQAEVRRASVCLAVVTGANDTTVVRRIPAD